MTLLKQHIEESQKEIKDILGLFIPKAKEDGVVSQERIEWELDFRSHILSSVASREKLLVEKLIKEIKNNLPKVITPTVEPPPNHLSQNQIFAGGQVNMATRVIEKLDDLLKSLE